MKQLMITIFVMMFFSGFAFAKAVYPVEIPAFKFDFKTGKYISLSYYDADNRFTNFQRQIENIVTHKIDKSLCNVSIYFHIVPYIVFDFKPAEREQFQEKFQEMAFKFQYDNADNRLIVDVLIDEHVLLVGYFAEHGQKIEFITHDMRKNIPIMQRLKHLEHVQNYRRAMRYDNVNKDFVARFQQALANFLSQRKLNCEKGSLQ